MGACGLKGAEQVPEGPSTSSEQTIPASGQSSPKRGAASEPRSNL